MEAVGSSETFVSCQNTAWSQSPDDHDLNLHHRENLKSLINDLNTVSGININDPGQGS